MNDIIRIFEGNQIRSIWDKDKEEWFFSVVDIVKLLTNSTNPRRYWSDLKRKMVLEENFQSYENFVQLKLKARDGKSYLTDLSNVRGILRIVQSITSPKAEPFKMWLSNVGNERMEEIIDPKITINRALKTYLEKGYSREWINQRLQSIQVRK